MNQQSRVILKDGNARSLTAKKQTREDLQANKQTQGVLGQTSEGTQCVLGESDVKGFDDERIRSLISSLKPIE